MFCVSKELPSILIHYEKPYFPEQEFLPVNFDLCAHITHINKEVGCPPMVLITQGKEKRSSFHVNHGYVKKTRNDNLVFCSRGGPEMPLDFSKTVSQNDTLLRNAQEWGIPNKVPIYKKGLDVSYQTLDAISLPRGWVGALTISRAEVTQFLVLYILREEREEAPFQRGPPPGKHVDKCTTFWAWYPSPKPQDLQTWLTSLSAAKAKAAFNELWSPIYEGYYRMAPVGYTESTDDSSPLVQIIYDDQSFLQSPAYFEPPSQQKRGGNKFQLVDDKRSKLSVSVDLALRTTKDSETSTWGFCGPKYLGWLTILPDSVKDRLFGPRRSPENVTEDWKKELAYAREEFTFNVEHEGIVFPGLRHDAQCNLQDNICGLSLLANESKREIFSRTQVTRAKKVAARSVVTVVIDDDEERGNDHELEGGREGRVDVAAVGSDKSAENVDERSGEAQVLAEEAENAGSEKRIDEKQKAFQEQSTKATPDDDNAINKNIAGPSTMEEVKDTKTETPSAVAMAEKHKAFTKDREENRATLATSRALEEANDPKTSSPATEKLPRKTLREKDKGIKHDRERPLPSEVYDSKTERPAAGTEKLAPGEAIPSGNIDNGKGAKRGRCKEMYPATQGSKRPEAVAREVESVGVKRKPDPESSAQTGKKKRLQKEK